MQVLQFHSTNATFRVRSTSILRLLGIGQRFGSTFKLLSGMAHVKMDSKQISSWNVPKGLTAVESPVRRLVSIPRRLAGLWTSESNFMDHYILISAHPHQSQGWNHWSAWKSNHFYGCFNYFIVYLRQKIEACVTHGNYGHWPGKGGVIPLIITHNNESPLKQVKYTKVNGL